MGRSAAHPAPSRRVDLGGAWNDLSDHTRLILSIRLAGGPPLPRALPSVHPITEAMTHPMPTAASPAPAPLSDEALVALVRGGDLTAFEEVMRRHHQRIY